MTKEQALNMSDRDKELARQAWTENDWDGYLNVPKLIDLIRADEREVWERRVVRLQSLMDVRESQPNKPCCLAEREACALICDEHSDDPVYCGAAIRSRGSI